MPIIAGAQLTASNFPLRTPDKWVLTCALLLLCTALGLFGKGRTPWKPVFLSAAVILSAWVLSSARQVRQAPPLLRIAAYTGTGVVTASPEEKAKTWKMPVLLTNESLPFKCLTYLEKSADAARLLPGDVIRIRMEIRPPNPPVLPGQFDYARYLARRNILATAYLDSAGWAATGRTDKRYALLRAAARIRKYAESCIDRRLEDKNAGLIKAMVLGRRSGLDPRMRTDFARAGIMHVLAVSGLHVSIVWMLVHAVFMPVLRLRPGIRSCTITLEVLAIWMFAFITGFGPAVQRAAFMFSLLALSRLTALRGKAVNLTAGSACILLLIRPEHLHEAGFQLSYCAVFGILLLYRKFYGLLHLRHPVLRYCWSVQAVSFAAVIGTAPLSIFYFQQFPLVFPAANLVAVPGAFLLVAGSLLLFILDGIPIAGMLLGQLLNTASDIMIRTTEFLAGHPWSSISPLYLDGTEVLAAYLLTGTFIGLVYARRRALPALLCLAAGIFLYRGSTHAIAYRATEYYGPEVLNDGGASGPALLHVGRNQFFVELEEDIRYDPYLRLDGNRKLNRIGSADTLRAGIDFDLLRLRAYLTAIDPASSGSRRIRDRAPRPK